MFEFNLIIGLLFGTYVILSLFLAVRTLRIYHDLRSLRYAFIIFSTDCYIAIVIVFLFNEEVLKLSVPALIVLYNIGMVFLLVGILCFTHAISNVIRTPQARFCSSVSNYSFAILLTLSIVDILYPVHFLYVVYSNQNWTITLHLLTKMVLLTALVPLIFVLLDLFSMRSPDDDVPLLDFTARTSRLFIIGALVLILLLTAALPLPIFGTGLGFYTLASLLMIFGGLFSYLSYRRPLFWILSGIVSPDPLIREGYVGYSIGAFLDNGPQILKVSDLFLKRMNVESVSLDILGINLLTLAGTEANSKITLVPIPQKDNLSALTFSFYVKNPEANDKRLQTNTAVVYSVLFPSVLRISLNQSSLILRTIFSSFQEKNNLQEIVNDEFLAKITITTLRLML